MLKSHNRAIVWYRNDLRLHDNQALIQAMQHAVEIIPVYVFDERLITGKTSYGFPKLSVQGAQFLIEGVANLRSNLNNLASCLVVAVGKPEEVIFELAKQYESSWVYCNRERTKEEVEVQDQLEKNLWSIGQELRYVRGKMLYHTADLPFPISQTPDVFGQFRKEVERFINIRLPLEAPQSTLPCVTTSVDEGDIPDLEQLGFDPADLHLSSSKLIGGEDEALRRLQSVIYEDALSNEQEDGRMICNEFTSHLSPYLAQGSLSPKKIYAELKTYEADHGENKKTARIKSELIWRDFLRLMAKKHLNKIFQPGGISGFIQEDLNSDWDAFNQWKNAETDDDFVNASMIELKSTGWISSVSRRAVANYLVHELKVNWLMGAQYFESQLIDYDPASNYGNWMYIAKVSNDPKEYRFSAAKSGNDEQDQRYIDYWLNVESM